MTKRKIPVSLSSALLFASTLTMSVVPIAPAQASEDCSAKSGGAYCYCLYNNALDDLREQSGSDSVSISKRIEIAKNALKRCLNRSTEEYQDGMNKVN